MQGFDGSLQGSLTQHLQFKLFQFGFPFLPVPVLVRGRLCLPLPLPWTSVMMLCLNCVVFVASAAHACVRSTIAQPPYPKCNFKTIVVTLGIGMRSSRPQSP